MPCSVFADGQGYHFANVPYATMRQILFEKNFTGLPAGVTRQSGSTVNWVEFGPPATSVVDNEEAIVTINPNTVSILLPR